MSEKKGNIKREDFEKIAAELGFSLTNRIHAMRFGERYGRPVVTQFSHVDEIAYNGYYARNTQLEVADILPRDKMFTHFYIPFSKLEFFKNWIKYNHLYKRCVKHLRNNTMWKIFLNTGKDYTEEGYYE